MHAKVNQLKRIANGGSHSDGVHLENKSGIRVHGEKFKAMKTSRQWAKIEEVVAQVESLETKHARHLEQGREEKKRWQEEAEQLQQDWEKLNDMRSKIQLLKQLSHR